MRKFVLSALSLLLVVGLSLAASVTVVSFDGKELKVKDGDKEMTYKVTEKTTYKAGDKEVTVEMATKALTKGAGKAKIEITTDKDTVTEIKMPAPKKKTDK